MHLSKLIAILQKLQQPPQQPLLLQLQQPPQPQPPQLQPPQLQPPPQLQQM